MDNAFGKFIDLIYIEGYFEKGSVNGEEFSPKPYFVLKLLKGSGKKNQEGAKKDFYSGKEMVEVPVIGKITAGAPILAVENITDTFPIPIDSLIFDAYGRRSIIAPP